MDLDPPDVEISLAFETWRVEQHQITSLKDLDQGMAGERNLKGFLGAEGLTVSHTLVGPLPAIALWAI